MTSSTPILAIDFGTSNSLLAAATADGVIAPIPLDPTATDPTVLRTVLFSPEKGKWFFGNNAIHEYQQHSADGRLFRSVKKYLPDGGFSGTQVHGTFRSLPEIIAFFLREMRERANLHFDKDCTEAVIGRPARFSDDPSDDRLAETRLEHAAKLAGFKSVAFVPEPVAAAHQFRHELTEDKNVVIADFGGGTSDFTVLRMGPGELKDKDILAIGGISTAGDAFDSSIMRSMIVPHFGSNVVYRLPMGSNDLRLPNNLITRMCSPADMALLMRGDILALLKDAQRWSLNPDDGKRMDRLFTLAEEHLGYALFRAIELCKIDFSTKSSSQFEFPHPGIELSETIQNKDFQTNSEAVVERIVKSLDATVASSGLSYAQIDVVCCTGGTARIPALNARLTERFGAGKLQQFKNFHSVVGGLAEKALLIARQK